MTTSQPVSQSGSHEVSNQPEPQRAVDLWGQDHALREHGIWAGGQVDHLAQVGAKWGGRNTTVGGNRCRAGPDAIEDV